MNKPIGDFSVGTYDNDDGSGVSPGFVSLSSGSVRVVVNSQIISEPEEYPFVFALFVLGFVIARRHLQKERQAVTS